MTRLEIRNLPAEEIRRDLLRELGGAFEGACVTGDGWRVEFVEGAPARLGRMVIPVLFLDISGEREAEVAAYLRRRTMRGGG